jgi:HlyD family secretion protein
MKKAVTLFKKRPIIYSIVILIVLVGVVYFINSRSANSTYQFITVNKGSITQEVTVTGNTTPIKSVDMAFQNGGTINAVNYPQGANVNAGAVVVTLNTSGLQAQLAQAQANVDTQKANLASLQAGATEQDVQVSQAAVTTAQQNLTNDYASVLNIITQAYSEANDAVHNQLAPLFSSTNLNQGSNPTLTFQVSDQNISNTVDSGLIQSNVELNKWQTELQSMSGNSSTSTLEAALSDTSSHLSVIQSFLIEVMTAANDSRGLSSNTAAYQADAAAATTEVNTAITSVNALTQEIASNKTVLQQQVASLNLKLAGSTQQAIQAQEAQVEQAEASVQNIQVSISEASLVAPISGVITVQNAKVGEIASPGSVLFSIISDNNLEVDSDVPEVDIGKVNVGDSVDMTLDAFSGEQFTGKVFYIDPAQTIVGGVVNYLVKVSFDKSDPRIKSGLTVNLNIITQTDNNVLILPQYAVIQNSTGSFVEVLKNNSVAQVPVTLGIQDQNGNIEITSGVTEGEQVLNIGLKQ